MDVQVIDRLRSLRTVVDDESEAIGAFPHANGARLDHHVAKQRGMVISRPADLSQPCTDFGDEQHVRGRLRCYVTENLQLLTRSSATHGVRSSHILQPPSFV